MERIKSGKYRRISSFCVYFFSIFITGFDMNSRTSQSIYYLRELNTSHIPLYQGMLIATCFVVGAIYGLLLGYLCDNYGNARALFIFSNTVGAIGTLIYSIPTSAPILVFGQFLNGFAVGGFTIAVAELARMYDGEILTRVFTLINVGFALGLVSGPLTNFALVNVNFEWGWYYIHPTNAPGYVVFTLLILLNIGAILFLFNGDDLDTYEAKQELDKEKSSLINNKDKDDFNMKYTNGDVTAVYMKSNEITLARKLKLLLGNPHLLLVYFGTFYWTFVLTGMEALIPLVAADWMGFKATQLSISYIVSGGVYIIANTGFAFIQHYINDLYSVVLLSLIQLSVPGLVWMMHYINGMGKSSMVIYYVWITLGSATWILEDVLTRAFCCKLVPLQFQGFAEGVRTIPRAIGLFTAGLFAGLWYQWTLIVSSILMVINILLIIGFISQRKSLFEPKRFSAT